ncbi:hypothetical protein Agub_g5264 [Astrephomene gubernaculifera]|uniref:Uncharacterized protein n=1 Tax=Astrephomene gubernaculifera TaxID=47775 RepID=A0AAD3DNQ0_9CHLO|nr:hypothetical protein Agub_g5264 [Astrephomene gubernaculifera]
MATQMSKSCEEAQLTLSKQETEKLARALLEKDRRVGQLSVANEHLSEHVQQLKSLVKDAHVRYEDELELTVASLQDQYNAAVDVLQLGAGLGAHANSLRGSDPIRSNSPDGCFGSSFHGGGLREGLPPRNQTAAAAGRPPGLSVQRSMATVGGADGGSSGCLTGGCTAGGVLRPVQQQGATQGLRASGGGCRKCQQHRCACSSAGGGQCKPASKAVATDPRVSLLGLDPHDFAPSTAYGATVGLVTEPVAVLRDVLNLDGAHDRERERQRERPATAGAAPVGISGTLV